MLVRSVGGLGTVRRIQGNYRAKTVNSLADDREWVLTDMRCAYDHQLRKKCIWVRELTSGLYTRKNHWIKLLRLFPLPFDVCIRRHWTTSWEDCGTFHSLHSWSKPSPGRSSTLNRHDLLEWYAMVQTAKIEIGGRNLCLDFQRSSG